MMKNVLAQLSHLAALIQAGNLRYAASLLRQYAWSRPQGDLYSKAFEPRTALWYGDPAVRIVRVSPELADPYLADIRQLTSERLHFDKGAICYLVYWDGQPCASGWVFPNSKFVNALPVSLGSLYAGSFYVKPSFRGHRLYRAMLDEIERLESRLWARAIIEIDADNDASIKGAARAGYRLTHSFRCTVMFGCIVRARLTPSGAGMSHCP